VEAVIDAGASTVNIPDTVGYTTPVEFGVKISEIKKRVPNIFYIDKAIISVHCHNDLGLAVANSLSAIENGARQVECTVNGIGKRAGNASLEELAMALKVRPHYYNVTHSIKTKELYNASKLVSRLNSSASK
jgi:2-isopropylmalate synthase